MNATPEEQAAIILEIAQGVPAGSVKRLEMELAARIVLASAPARGAQERLLLVAQECIRQMEWARQHDLFLPLTLAPEGWKP